MAWAKNGTPDTLGSAGDTLSISDLTAKKFNQFFAHALSVTGNTQHKFRYNNNSNPVYAYRYNVNGGSDNPAAPLTLLEPDPTGTNVDKFSVNYTVSISGEEKLCIIYTITGGGEGAGTAPARMEFVGKFVPSPDSDIERIDLFNASAGDFDTSSNLSALGTD